jgi:hypothetical protein
MSMRRMTDQSLAFGRTAPQAGQVCFGRRFVDEDKPRRLERALAAFPVAAGLGDVGPVLLGRVERLFLYVSPSLPSTQWIAPIVQPKPNRCLISSKVTSGSLATNCRMLSPCSGSSRPLRPQNLYLGLRSPVRLFCANSFFTIPTDTLKRFANASLVPSQSFPSNLAISASLFILTKLSNTGYNSI